MNDIATEIEAIAKKQMAKEVREAKREHQQAHQTEVLLLDAIDQISNDYAADLEKAAEHFKKEFQKHLNTIHEYANSIKDNGAQMKLNMKQFLDYVNNFVIERRPENFDDQNKK